VATDPKTVKDAQGRPVLLFTFERKTCEACLLFERCVHSKTEGRSIRTHYHETLLQDARARQQTDEFKQIYVLRAAIERFQAPLVETIAGDRLRIGDACRAKVLHPTLTRRIASDNANSLVLLLEYQGRRILLTGDLEPPGLDDVIAEASLDCDVILAPHHGSLRSNPSAFAAWSTPEWVVVSGGHADNRPEFDQAYERYGAQILNTADCGAISVRISAGELQVETLRKRSSPAPARAEDTLHR